VEAAAIFDDKPDRLAQSGEGRDITEYRVGFTAQESQREHH
jgi:hypothetical protein